MGKQDKGLSQEVLAQITVLQQNEVTEYHIYKHLSRIAKSNAHSQALNQLAGQELEHYRFLMQYGDEIDPRWSTVKTHEWMASLFGLGFSLRMLEKLEQKAMENYQNLSKVIPEAAKIAQEEQRHLHQLSHIASEVRGRVSNTWLIGINLSLYVLWSVLIFAIFQPAAPIQKVLYGWFAILAVSVADMTNTTLLRHANPVRLNSWLKPLWRLVLAAFLGGVVLFPMVVIQQPVIGMAVSLTLLVMVSLSINLYFAVVNELALATRMLRIVTGFFITAVVAIALNLLASVL